MTVTFWCQQCWPLTGSGCTGNVRFWWTPASSHHTRSESGSSLFHGPHAVQLAHPPLAGRPRRCRSTSAVDQRSPPDDSDSRKRVGGPGLLGARRGHGGPGAAGDSPKAGGRGRETELQSVSAREIVPRHVRVRNPGREGCSCRFGARSRATLYIAHERAAARYPVRIERGTSGVGSREPRDRGETGAGGGPPRSVRTDGACDSPRVPRPAWRCRARRGPAAVRRGCRPRPAHPPRRNVGPRS